MCQFFVAQDSLVIDAASRFLLVKLVLEHTDFVIQSLKLYVEGRMVHL